MDATIQRIVDTLRNANPKIPVTLDDVKVSNGKCQVRVMTNSIEVNSNLIRPHFSAVVFVHKTLGEKELLNCSLRVIDVLRTISVVESGMRMADDKSYHRMEIRIMGIG